MSIDTNKILRVDRHTPLCRSTRPPEFPFLVRGRYNDEPEDPLILGRSFLATAGAQIDVRKGKIKLDLGDIDHGL